MLFVWYLVVPGAAPGGEAAPAEGSWRACWATSQRSMLGLAACCLAAGGA